jgi:hypothetical protein
MNNTLAKLILEALLRAEGYSVPESTLVDGLKNMVRPPADAEDFRDSFIILLQRDLVGFENDKVTDERKFRLKEQGRNYLRDL